MDELGVEAAVVDERSGTLLQSGLLARNRGDLPAAVAAFRELCAQTPDSAGARCELAFTLLRSGELDEAEAICRSVLVEHPDAPPALATLGGVLRAKGDAQGTLAAFARAAKAEPGNIRALAEVASSLRDLGRFEEAAKVYFDVLALEPSAMDALRGLAESYRALGRHAPSLFFYTLLAERDPIDREVLAERGFALMRLGRTEEAESVFQAASALDPDDPTPYRGLAKVAEARGGTRAAIGFLNEALRRQPADRWALMDLGFARRALDDRPGALEAFFAAASLDPILALPEVALEHRAMGRPAEALAVLGRVIDVDPANLAAGLRLAELARAQGDLDRSVALCRALMARHPDRLELVAEMCRALIGSDRKPEAVVLARSLSVDGRSPAGVHVLRLEVAGACGDADFAAEALAFAEPAFDDVDVKLAAVAARLALADANGARSLLATLIAPSRTFDLGRLREMEARLADLEWRPDDAIRGYLASLEANPDNAEAHGELARLYLLTMEPERSTEHLGQFLRRAAADRRLRGQSVRLSQNLVGQLLNELKLDENGIADLTHLHDLDMPIETAIAAAGRHAASTPAALHLLLRLRTSGVLVSGAEVDRFAARGPCEIPRSIFTFWPDDAPPRAIARGLEERRGLHAGWRHTVFDRRSGQAHLEANCAPEVAAAGRHAMAGDQFADLLRLAVLHSEGGYFVDARARCLAPLDQSHPSGARLVLMQDEFAALARPLLVCAPGEAVVGRALRMAVEAVNRGDNDIPWLATGPGLLSRAFVGSLIERGDDWRRWLGRRRVLDRAAVGNLIIPEYFVGRPSVA